MSTKYLVLLLPLLYTGCVVREYNPSSDYGHRSYHMDRPYERAGYNNDTVVYTREIRTTPIGYESRYGEHHNIIVSEPQSNRRVIQISDPHRSVTNNVIIENKPKSEENRKVKDIINNNNVFNKNERNNSSYDGRDRLNYR